MRGRHSDKRALMTAAGLRIGRVPAMARAGAEGWATVIDEEALAALVAHQPMNRLARPEEIAVPVAHAAPDGPSTTTRALHVIDGNRANI